jgi:serine/threonine protein phosphatase PrpC
MSFHSAIENAFHTTDLRWLEENESISQSIGSTANIVMIVGDRILTVNLGDSRSILCRNGIAYELSADHKP